MSVWQVSAIPPTAAHWLANTHTARVLHLFDHACNLVNEEGEVLSLLAADYGRHPFALSLPHAPHFPHYATADAAVRVRADGLWVGGLQVQWGTAEPWNPIPNWAAITPARWTAALPVLRGLLVGREHIRPPTGAGAEWLIGRGPGLTPAGDDFLMGWLYGDWGRGTGDARSSLVPSPLSLVLPSLLSRTTTLSAAYLRAALRGEAAESWHNLVRAMGEGTAESVAASGRAILATGHTSGADALFGFVCGGEGHKLHD